MGAEDLEAGANGIEKSSYQVIVFPGHALPEQYRNMVLSKWKRSLKYGNEYFKLCDADAFFKAYDRYIPLILSRPNSAVRIAVLSDARDVALGWSVVSGKTLHYVHVNHEQRNRGIAKSLVPAFDTFTHLTKSGLRIWSSKFPSAVFNPF